MRTESNYDKLHNVRVSSKRTATFYRVNWQIRASEVRLIDEQGKQIGVMPLEKARQQATLAKLDLVEIAPKAVPPVVKLINYAKFKYQETKKLNRERKTQRGGLKEIRLTPFIEESDLEFRLKKIKEFLKKGYLVRVTVKFRGRQIGQQSFGYDLIEKVAERVDDFGDQEAKPKLMGKMLITTFRPKKNEKKETENPKLDSQPLPSH